MSRGYEVLGRDWIAEASFLWLLKRWDFLGTHGPKKRESGPGWSWRVGVFVVCGNRKSSFSWTWHYSTAGGGWGILFPSDSCLSLSFFICIIPPPFLFVVLSMRYDIFRLSLVGKKNQDSSIPIFLVS